MHYLVKDSNRMFERALTEGKKLVEKGTIALYELSNEYGGKYILSFKEGIPFKIISKPSKFKTTIYDKNKGILVNIYKEGDMFTREVMDAETSSMKGFFSLHIKNNNQIDMATFCTPRTADAGIVNYDWKYPNMYSADKMSIPIKTRFKFHNMNVGLL